MEFIIDIKNRMGVYTITNLVNRKVYFGSTTVCLHKRMIRHLSRLKSKKHRNKYLQRSFDKYGEENFYFEVLEIVDKKEDVRTREAFWLNAFWGSGRIYNLVKVDGYNVGDKPSNYLSEKYQGEELIDPDGNIILFEGTCANFARKHDICATGLYRLFNGISRHSQGWSLKKHNLPSFVSPEGVIYDRIYNIALFARKHNLNKSSLQQLVRHEIKYHNGWTLVGSYLPTLISPEGKIFERVCNLSSFAKKNNLSGSMLSSMILGNQRTHKGWTCVNPKTKKIILQD